MLKLFDSSLRSRSLVLIAVVIGLGAFFRLYDLDNPGFWGDEETSSIPAKSVAMGQGPTFASGMPYRRALPLTYISAWTAKLFGTDKDRSYRLPSAVLGIAFLFLIYLGTKRFFGFYVALAATTLIAFSEWHILLSRTARMYGPLLFFTTAFCFASFAWYYADRNKIKYLLLSCSLYIVATTLNFSAILVLPILILPSIISRQFSSQFFTSMVTASTLGLFSITYSKIFIQQPYDEFLSSRSAEMAVASYRGIDIANVVNEVLPNTSSAGLGVIGLAIGIYAFTRLKRISSYDENPFLLFGTAITSVAFGLFVSHGYIYGSLMCLFFMVILVPDFAGIHRKLRHIGLFFLVAISLMSSFNIYKYGFIDGAKYSLSYPFPYLLYQLYEYPGVVLLFFVGAISAFCYGDTPQRNMIKSLSIAIITPAFLYGLFRSWAPPRFFVTAYPLMLIVASIGLVRIVERAPIVRDSRVRKITTILFVCGTGIVGSHGIPQSASVSPVDYGSLFYGNHNLGIRFPDHRSHGCFVNQHLRKDDIVVAEDALQMFWYIGRVDYWLRDPSNIDDFLYFDGSSLRDFYVNSQPTTDEIIAKLGDEENRRIWVITSGETQQFLDHFLPSETIQRQWLDHVVHTNRPVLRGRDNLSATYCLNCDFGDALFDPWEYDCHSSSQSTS